MKRVVAGSIILLLIGLMIALVGAIEIAIGTKYWWIAALLGTPLFLFIAYFVGSWMDR